MSGKIISYYDVCPDVGGEMRAIMVCNHPCLPNDNYGLIDAYCADPECDCRIAYIMVVGESRPGKVLASITFGWESLRFYAKWMGTDETDRFVRNLKGPALMHMGPRTKLAPALLELVIPRLQEDLYIKLLKRHYNQFKATLRKGARPSR